MPRGPTKSAIVSPFFLFTFVIEIIDFIQPAEDKFKKEYLNDHINLIIMTLTILTILIRIICIFFMKSYSEILEKKDDFLRAEEQDKFIEDLEEKMEKSYNRWSVKNNISNEKKNNKKNTKNYTEIEDNTSYLNEN